jgi:hypothetical protein
MAKETMSAAAVATVLQGVNAPAANTNALPANTNKSLAVYDKNGNLIGYVPVFTTEW